MSIKKNEKQTEGKCRGLKLWSKKKTREEYENWKKTVTSPLWAAIHLIPKTQKDDHSSDSKERKVSWNLEFQQRGIHSGHWYCLSSNLVAWTRGSCS